MTTPETQPFQLFGVLVPIARDQHGRTLDGHHRVRVADELGVTYRVDVIKPSLPCPRCGVTTPYPEGRRA